MFQLTNKIWKTRNAYVLVSEINENERLIQELADEFRYLSPNDFAGEKRYVYYKMNYVEPFKEFNELKKLQIAVKTVTGMRANFKGIVAIDVQEWMSHFKEDYFLITLKFLHDQLQNGWRYVFTVGNRDKLECKQLIVILARYFKPYVIEITPFNSKYLLQDYVMRYLAEVGKDFSLDTHRKFVNLLLEVKDEELKDLEIVRNIVRDIADSTNKKLIGTREFKAYLMQSDSLMTLLVPDLRFEMEKGGLRNE